MQIRLDENTEYIIKKLESYGFSAFAVGGCVRNQIIGIPVTDVDITTSGTPDEMKSVFKGETLLETGIKHGTLTLIRNKIPFEITTFRKETEYSDSRHPDSVSFVTDVNEDLSRRDFTVNAIAFSPSVGLVDPYGGVDDIKNRIIRAVGNPQKRFSEDALRILRALRFSSTLSFSIEANTKKSAFELFKTLDKISPERIFSELKKLVCGDNALSVLTEFRSVFGIIMPIKNNIDRLSKLPKNPAMRFAYICDGDISDVLTKLRSDNKTKSDSALLSNSSPIPKNNSELKEYISFYGKESSLLLSEYRRIAFDEDIDNNIEKLLKSDETIFLKDLALNGKDLEKIGIKGKSVGKILSELLSYVHHNPTENKKELLLEKAKAMCEEI